MKNLQPCPEELNHRYANSDGFAVELFRLIVLKLPRFMACK